MKGIILTIAILGTSLAFASSKLEPLARYSRGRGVEYNDVWGYTDGNGREYALLGVKNGTSIIDVTDAANLKEIKFIPSASSIWKDIKTYRNYAYIVNETGGGMQILDLSLLPEKVELVATYTAFTTSHNLFIDEERGLLFAEGTHSQAVRILSLENPEAPVQLSSFGVECHDIFARDGLAYISEGGHGSVGIFNYEEPSNPVLVGRFGIQRSGYLHNVWLTEDSKYLMSTEENTNKTMKMFDIQDLENVEQVGEILAPGKLAHNTHIKGDFAYVSHYGSGFRIYDVSNPAQMNEVAYWMRGSNPESGFVSNWGAYPFFKSGKILVSDIEQGLVVLYHDSAREE